MCKNSDRMMHILEILHSKRKKVVIFSREIDSARQLHEVTDGRLFNFEALPLDKPFNVALRRRIVIIAFRNGCCMPTDSTDLVLLLHPRTWRDEHRGTGSEVP